MYIPKQTTELLSVVVVPLSQEGATALKVGSKCILPTVSMHPISLHRKGGEGFRLVAAALVGLNVMRVKRYAAGKEAQSYKAAAFSGLNVAPFPFCAERLCTFPEKQCGF